MRKPNRAKRRKAQFSNPNNRIAPPVGVKALGKSEVETNDYEHNKAELIRLMRAEGWCVKSEGFVGMELTGEAPLPGGNWRGVIRDGALRITHIQGES